MTPNEFMKKLWTYDRQIAHLRYRYYEIFTINRSLAMKLFGYRSTSPDKFDENILKRMEFYVFSGRYQEEH